jgi:NAD(P)-dependent dehydrogenase (short-subunit alcohol dehydrogenase family)
VGESADLARKALIIAGTLGAGLIVKTLAYAPEPSDLAGRVVLITGGSRGLGLLMAHEFARQGCQIAICARDVQELEHAKREIEQISPGALALPCDVADESQVKATVEKTIRHFGRIDVLVNNAGIIAVGPIETMTRHDFEQAMNVMFWGTVSMTLAVLPEMIKRKSGRIVNITSIGGKVSVPHLLPYSCAKFAVVAFSEGLRAELAKDRIPVTTIIPGLMRTGSHVNAFFKGHQNAEFTWFSLGATSRVAAIDPERAAHDIVKATKAGQAEATLGLPAMLLAGMHHLFPGLTTDLLGLVNEFVLPSVKGSAGGTVRGSNLEVQLKALALDIFSRIRESRAKTSFGPSGDS